MGIEQIRELKRQAGVPKTPKKYSIPKKSKKKFLKRHFHDQVIWLEYLNKKRNFHSKITIFYKEKIYFHFKFIDKSC